MNKDRIYLINLPNPPQVWKQSCLQFQKDNDYTDIVKNSTFELEKGIAVEC